MLTDTACKNAHRGDKAKLGKAFKLSDEKGLYLHLKPQSDGWGKLWRFKYRFGDKEKLLAFGTYPETSLDQARQKREDARKLLAGGVDPGATRKAEKEATSNTLKAIALEWLEAKCEDNDPHRPKRQLDYILPWLGHIPINEVQPKEIMACLRRAETNSGIPSAKKALQKYGQIWRYAVSTGRADRDITQYLKGSLQKHKTAHFSAITEPKYAGSFIVKSALQLSPLLFQRPGDTRHEMGRH